MFVPSTRKHRRVPSSGVRPLLPTVMDEAIEEAASSGEDGGGCRPFPRPLHGATAGLRGNLHGGGNTSISNKGFPPAPPAAIATDAHAAGGRQGSSSATAAMPKSPGKGQRGMPLMQWVWPANSGLARVGSEWFRGAGSGADGGGTRGGKEQQQQQQQQENRVRLQGRTQKSSVVVGTVCQPVRPTRLDLAASQGYPTSSRVIYTAKGGHASSTHAHAKGDALTLTTAAVAAAAKSASARPSALKLPSSPHPADDASPWLDSLGRSFGGVGGGGGRSRGYSAHSTSAAGLLSPRYLQSTTVSQAKAVEPSGKNHHRAEQKHRSSRRSNGGGQARGRGRRRETVGGAGGGGGGGESDVGFGACGGGFGGGMLESLGGFLGIGRGGDGTPWATGAVGGGGGGKDAAGWGKSKRAGRSSAGNNQAARGGSIGPAGEGKIGSNVFSRLRNRSTDGTHSRYGNVKVRAPSSGGGGGGRQGLKPPPGDEYAQRSRVVLRRDEREVVTMHTPGVLRPEGVKLRVVKASGRTLEDTKFHMEIRTLRPGQVWSVCRRYKDFQSLHSCLQATFPALVLPRLPRPPTGGGGMALEPATLERARAGLQAYAAAVVGSVPAAWGLEELVMFLDSEEKGRRLFSSRKRRKKEATRRVVALPSPAAEKEEEEEEEGEEEEEEEAEEEEEEEEDFKPVARKAAALPPDLVSPKAGTPGVGFGQKSLLDLKVQEKKLALAALEGAAANHFDGVGAVMNTAVSFSEDSDDGASQEFGEESDFIDGEDAIRAMLDRDADEAEDDNLFSIPAGTDFGIPLDDDDDDDDQDCSADAFDITYHG